MTESNEELGGNPIYDWDSIVKSYQVKRKYDKFFLSILSNPQQMNFQEFGGILEKKKDLDKSFYEKFEKYISIMESY